DVSVILYKVLQQLAQYGIERIEMIRVPEDISNNRKVKTGDTKSKKKIKGFAFLEFSTHSEAAAAFQRLKKPDVVFGRDVSAKVSFEQSAKPSTDEDVGQVKEICEKYGEIVKIDLHMSSKPKHKDFGFVTFSSRKSALACVEGINTTGIVGETKIIASIARATKKQGLHGGAKNEKKNEVTKLDKEGEVSNKASDRKSIKMKGVLNSQQTNINGKDSSKNKIKAGIGKPQRKGLVKKQNFGEAVKGEKQSHPSKKDGESSKPKNKRKASSEKNSIAPPDLRQGGQGNSKKPKKGGEGQNNKTNPKAGNNKRKQAPAYEGREDRDNRNAHGKQPLKKHKGGMHGRERDNYRNPQSDARVIRGHDDYRNSTRYVDPYAPTYAASTSATYHLGSDSVSARQRQEMEPHAGYIQPAAKHSQSYSGYIQPAVRQHQPVYLESASTSQSYSRYLDHPVMTQSHRRYIETPAVSEVQPYRGYRQSEIVQIAHDPYDPGLTRVVRQDNRGSGVLSYIGGPSLPASHVPNPTSYYQRGSTYSGAYGGMHGRERDNYRNPQSDARVIRGHDDYRNSTRYVDPYAPTYAASTSATYHLGSDSVSARQRQEMEPHAGYIQPAAKHSQSYSGYIQPAVRQHQPVYLESASTSQSYSRYLDHPVMTQSHRRYIETPAVSEVQPYRGYRQSEIVQIAHDPYDPGLTRVVRQDNRGSGVLSYIGGPSLPASHVPNPTSYYQRGSTYSGAYGIGRPYY
nr:nucleotide-binding, alpha-beta plait [Tanacetum cinerariifolium]